MRIDVEGVLVGADGCLVLAGLGQCIALVVQRIGTVGRGPGLLRRGIVLGAVGRRAAQGRIPGQGLRRLRITGGQGARGLLVGTPPQIRKSGRLCRSRRHDQDQGKCHQPAAAEAEQGQGQQQQHEPGAAVAEALAQTAALALSGRLRLQRIIRQQGMQVAAITAQRGIASTAGRGQCAQCRFLQPRQHDVALGILQESTLRQRHRRAAVAADPKHRNGQPRRMRLAGSGNCRVADAVGEQDQFAAIESGLRNQFLRAGDRPFGGIADHRHDAGIQRIDQVAHGVDVIGQRCGDKGVSGITDQGGLHVATLFENVVELVARALQPGRLDVGGKHGRGKFDRQHAGRIVLVKRHWLAFPGGAGHGQASKDPGRAGEQYGAAFRALDRGVEQMRQQMRIDHRPPVSRLCPLPLPDKRRQGQQGQRQQPPRTQEVKVGECAHGCTASRDARRRSHGRISARMASNIAMAIGNQYSSSTGRRVSALSATGSSWLISR